MERLKKYWWAGGLLLVVIAVLFAPLASPYPDGLERVAEEEGFLDRAQEGPYTVLPDYMFPDVGDDSLSTILAGLIGVLIVFGLTCMLAWVFRRRPGQVSR